MFRRRRVLSVLMERAQVVARVSRGHYHLVSRIASDAHR
jgi:hypothetical protein